MPLAHAQPRQVHAPRALARQRYNRETLEGRGEERYHAAPHSFGTMMTADFANSLIEATLTMHESGVPFMRRVIPKDQDVRLWDHYPADDAISPRTKSRYFYHCHPPAERGVGEHGHFHFFLPKSVIGDPLDCRAAPIDLAIKRADVVHVAALSISADGLPLEFFTVNRWVTDEWLYSAASIAVVLDRFDLTGADGDPHVNQWLTAIVALARPLITDLLETRDAVLSAAGWLGEDRAIEITSRASVDLQSIVDRALTNAA